MILENFWTRRDLNISMSQQKTKRKPKGWNQTLKQIGIDQTVLKLEEEEEPRK